MTGITHKLAPAPKSAISDQSYRAQFPALPLPSQRLPSAHGSTFGGIEHELTAIMNGSSYRVQLERPLCPSPTNLRIRVGSVITGWNPPISLADRAKWKDAYNAYQQANVAFDTTGKLGEFPPLMNFPHVNYPSVHY